MPSPRRLLALLAVTLPTGCTAPPRGTSDAGAPREDAGAPADDAAAPADDAAAPAEDAATPAGDAGAEGKHSVVKAPLPEAALGAVLGCWQFKANEQWVVDRTAEGGARLTRKPRLLPGEYDWGRGLTTFDLLYDTADGRFAFQPPGHHPTLFIFRVVDDHLEGSWFTSHTIHPDYTWTGSNSTLHRCKGPAGR